MLGGGGGGGGGGGLRGLFYGGDSLAIKSYKRPC